MRQQLKRLIPPTILPFAVRLVRHRDRIALNRVGRIACDTTALSRSIDHSKLREIFTSHHIDSEWPELEREISRFSIPDNAGGVNPGDRRAIYYLVRHLCPKAVLEIGTHIGASTVHIIAALRKCYLEDQANVGKLVTVDICDVNDVKSQPWLQWGSNYSPGDMTAKLGASDWVTFVTDTSIEYLSSCMERFDFIFLDGSHSAQTVYREIPAALKVLNRGGVILLHDYFPSGKALWSDGSLIEGPWLATQRLKSEGARFDVLPLNELPWPTKLNSKKTSLALLVGE